MPNPSDYSNEGDFVSACISARQDEHPDEDTDQSAAICYSVWSDKMDKPVNKTIQPMDGEDQSDFMDRCSLTGADDDTCQEIWDECMGNGNGDYEMSGKDGVVRKTHITNEVQGLEFTLSDETVDRYDDVIMADGWDLANFKKNPIALFNHNSSFIVGKWKNLRVVDKALRGHLEPAPAGTSDRIDEIRRLIEAGILRATSVGFHPKESKPRSKSAPGNVYTKSELVEVSLVSIPANPNCLAVAKSLKISSATQDLVFAKPGTMKTKVVQRSANGKSAENPPVRKNGKMSNAQPIAQRIKDTEQQQTVRRDKLAEIMKVVGEEGPTEDQQTEIDALTGDIDTGERSLATLQRVEKSLAFSSRPVSEAGNGNGNGSEQAMELKNHRPFAAPMQKFRPSDWIWKALTVQVKAQANPRLSIPEIMQKTYPGQDRLHDNIQAMHSGLVTRGAQTVGTTTTATWAAELVTVGIGDFFDLLQPVSIYAALSALGGRFTFGPNGVVSIPYRTNTATVGGAFVAQGGNIPVKKASFSAINLTPKKAAVISTFTRELAEHSTPSIEALLREAIVNDTATAIDAILMDTNVATTTRPAGLGAGLTTQTPTSPGTDLTGVIGDLKVMSNALSAASNGNIRTPVWIMTPGAANCIGLSTISTIGTMPFRDEINAGRFNSWPVIKSTNTIPSDTIWLLDANDFVTATGDVPRFDISDQAVIVMDDAPTDIVTGGTAFAGAVKSMWQTDSIAVRMIMDVNWAMRRSGMVLFMTGINWSP